MAFTLNSVANAQQAAFTNDMMAILQQNAVARQYLETNLGLRTSSVKDANKALTDLRNAGKTGEVGLIMKSVNDYTSKAVAGNSPAAVSQNAAAAAAAFKTSTGEIIKVAAVAQGAGSTESTTAKAGTVTCSQKVDPREIYVQGGPSLEKLEKAAEVGVIANGGKCGETPGKMEDPRNKRLFNETAACALDKGITAATPDSSAEPVFGECLSKANQDLASAENTVRILHREAPVVVSMTADEGTQAIQKIDNEAAGGCGWFAQARRAEAAKAARQ